MNGITFVKNMLLFLISAAALLPLSASADNEKRKHSRLIAQLTQFDGGCPPNECEDVRFSIHRAPACTNGPDASVANYSVSMIREFSGPLSGGSSTLARADDGLAFSLTTSGLRPNAPYTIWWVGFNPDNQCITDGDVCNCSVDSLRPGADSVFYATGGMSDRLGTATFAGHIEFGDVPSGFDQVPFGGIFGVSIRPGAEIHFVVRAHGRALQGKSRRNSDDDDN